MMVVELEGSVLHACILESPAPRSRVGAEPGVVGALTAGCERCVLREATWEIRVPSGGAAESGVPNS